jgi:MFS family permease
MNAAEAPRVPERQSRLRHTAFSLGWFGLNFHWLPIGFVLIQAQIHDLVPAADQPLAIGEAVGLGGILAVLVPPLTGLLSDHLHTPLGRRRPLVVVGLAGNVLGLAIMATASSYWRLVAGYLVIQLFNNAAGAAYAAIIPDQVAGREYGRASGWLAAMYNLGGILGVLATLIFSTLHMITATYWVIAVVVVLSFFPILALATEGPAPARAPRKPVGQAVRDFLAPLAGGDFAWVVLTRLFVTGAINVVAYFLSPFFANVIHVPNASQFTSIWLLLVFIAAVPLGWAGGGWSDRTGRKPFVYGSGAFQGLVALIFIIFYPRAQPILLALAVIYGLGYGLYYAVDWALAVDTLPDRYGAAAKDMGLFHVAYTLPQVIMPVIGGALIEALNGVSPGNGYRIVFALSIVFFGLGTVLVSRIRAIR